MSESTVADRLMLFIAILQSSAGKYMNLDELEELLRDARHEIMRLELEVQLFKDYEKLRKTDPNSPFITGRPR